MPKMLEQSGQLISAYLTFLYSGTHAEMNDHIVGWAKSDD
jgi:hypothetical protein